ncbi:MAG: A/G-specific adenine glycosylase [Pseudomonadota bacterium]
MASLSDAVLAWYDKNARVLPWRVAPADCASGAEPDPYKVWLSEIMLQQTTVAAVIPYYEKFTSRWPTVEDLAAATPEDVMAAWAGLGYYSRARNLHRCAAVVAERHGGAFPSDEASLLELPGVGPYTAAAIAAIAFDQRAVVVDGNIERVMARAHAVAEALPGAKKRLKTLTDAVTPDARCGDFAQALMDIGAGVCTPKRPSCLICPIEHSCAARKAGTPEAFPVKKPKPEKPTRRGAAFAYVREDGAVLLERRPPKGLLGGALGLPTTDWTTEGIADPLQYAPVSAKWRALDDVVRHTFTHFHLELSVYRADADAGGAAEAGKNDRYSWGTRPEDLPTVMRKAWRAASSARPEPRRR